MEDDAVNAIAPDCLLMALMAMVLASTIVNPVDPMIFVTTDKVDASTIKAWPMAYLTPPTDIVLVSLMLAWPMAYRTAAVAMVLVSLMLAAASLMTLAAKAIELVLEMLI